MKRLLFLALVFILISGRAFSYPDRFLGDISLDLSPIALRVHPKNRFLFVLGSSNRLDVVDMLQQEVVGNVSFSGSGVGFAYSPVSFQLYVISSIADRVYQWDLTHSIRSPKEEGEIPLSTSGVTFDDIFLASTGSQDELILIDREEKRLYVYLVEDQAFRKNGTKDYAELNFSPVLAQMTDDRRLVLVSEEGLVETWNTDSLTKLGVTLDVGVLTSNNHFSGLAIGKVGLVQYGFLANTSSEDEGEVFYMSFGGRSGPNRVIDTDPDKSDINPILTEGPPKAMGFSEVQRSFENQDQTANYLYVYVESEGSIKVFDAANFGGTAKVEPFSEIENVPMILANSFVFSASTDGYLYSLKEDASAILVFSDHPTIEFSDLPTSPVGQNEITVSVLSSSSGRLRVFRYLGDELEPIDPSNGVLLKSVSLTKDLPSEVAISLEEFPEGESLIAGFLEDNGRLGRAGFVLQKDLPPPTPDNFSLNFGNQRIYVDWKKVSVEDMSHYLVYFGTDSQFTGIDGLSSPKRVEHPSSSVTLENVPNGVPIFVRVVAVDETGNQSEPTKTKSETAEETEGILLRSGETGGCAVTSSGDGSFLLLFVIFVLFVLLRRRERSLLRSFLLVFLLIPTMIPNVQAESLAMKELGKESTLSFEAGVRFFKPGDDVTDAYFGGFGNLIYQVRAGYLWNHFDFGLGIGVSYEESRTIGVVTGRASGEKIKLWAVPFEATGQYNFQFGKPRVFEPFLRGGYGLLYYDVSEVALNQSGAKHYWVGGLGLRFVLSRIFGWVDQDLLGMDSLYLMGMGEYRYQFTDGLDFSGWIINSGIGFEF